jgi:hypothetical protein
MQIFCFLRKNPKDFIYCVIDGVDTTANPRHGAAAGNRSNLFRSKLEPIPVQRLKQAPGHGGMTL